MTEKPVQVSGDSVLSACRQRQRESWQGGAPLLVEALIANSDSSALSEDAVLELIVSEVELREEFGESVSQVEFFGRFPQLRSRLERLFLLRAALENTHSGSQSEQPTDSESPRPDGSAGDTPFQTVAEARPFPVANPIEERILGSYHLLDKIGQGGMGAVYKALHKKLKKVVAIKVLPHHLMSNPSLMARFQREMESVGALDHPNIVRAMDAGEVAGTHFLVMEFVEGDDLSKIVKAQGPLPLDEALDVIQQVAAGLQHAHESGMVHRDIKPSNIIWTRGKQAKVLDLGLARCQLEAEFAESELTETGQALGTIDYMSPEQARSPKTVDGRADIYSLGCTLYFLLTGQPLYPGRNRVEKLFSHRDDPIPIISRIRNNVPAELERIYLRMVAKKVEDRFSTMNDVVSALKLVPLGLQANLETQSAVESEIRHDGTEFATVVPDTNFNSHGIENESATSLDQDDSRLVLRERSWLSTMALGTVFLVLLLVIALVFNRAGPLGLPSRSDDLIVPDNAKSQGNADLEGNSALSAKADSGLRKDDPSSVAPKTDSRIDDMARLAKEIRLKKLGSQGQQSKSQEEWAKDLGNPIEYSNSLKMKFRLIPPGQFQMGASDSDEDAHQSERPQHGVELTTPFYLGSHEVTQAQFAEIMGTNPSFFDSSPSNVPQLTNPQGNSVRAKLVNDGFGNHPVDGVTWTEAREFCTRLSQKEGRRYRLPTEAEWEYACRAGTTTRYPTGDNTDEVYKTDNVAGRTDSPKRPIAVGTKPANSWGLYDMNGNVREWCSDWFGEFRSKSAIDPTGPKNGVDRVVRGGCFFYGALSARSSCRFGLEDGRARNRGFRVVMDLKPMQGNPLDIPFPAPSEPIFEN